VTRPARVIVDIAAVKANFKVVQKRAPTARVMAIIKADGYGHGIVRIAGALSGHADAFGVASLEEAIKVREAGIETPVVLLEGPFSDTEIGDIEAHHLETVVHNHEQVAWLSRARSPFSIWIKIDSGMHRLGFAPHDVAAVEERLQRPDRVIRYMTQLANAHQADDLSVQEQLDSFRSVVAADSEHSIANSAAILAWPDAHANWVRPGLMLYGVSPFSGQCGRDYTLRPVMTVASELISVREVGSGGSVGYGRGYICPEPMRVGVVAFGYGDGYPRHAGTGTPILVGGVRTQVIGQASMDMLTVDLRPVPGAAVGAAVVMWGPDLPVEEIADHAATIPYELLCRVRMRARYIEYGG
jgi:alanine racemase